MTDFAVSHSTGASLRLALPTLTSMLGKMVLRFDKRWERLKGLAEVVAIIESLSTWSHVYAYASLHDVLIDYRL